MISLLKILSTTCVLISASEEPSLEPSPRPRLDPTIVLFAHSINHPPVNLYDSVFITDFHKFLLSLNNTVPSPKVVVVASTLPGFFVSNLDLRLASTKYPVPPQVNSSAVLDTYFDVLNLLSTLPQVFIGEVDGNAYGAGNELLMHMDMRFAGPHASLGAPEIGAGLIHQGGIQTLSKLIGTGLTSEYMLSGLPISGAKAAAVGWVNSVYDTSNELTSAVNALASRISLFPSFGIAANKASIRVNGPDPVASARDAQTFVDLVPLPTVQFGIDRFIELSLNETDSPFEANLLEDLPEIWTT
ncbi:ClpP/crotonase-like domain-containing protein [Xylogone sp. PMI_703]|nr:ClpP/crotonase-like domain-containing protein [Xylogone sp. PMI_703]